MHLERDCIYICTFLQGAIICCKHCKHLELFKGKREILSKNENCTKSTNFLT